MGGMMGSVGATGAWMVVWILLGVALLVSGGIVAVRVLAARRSAGAPPIQNEEPGLQEARAALKRRFANGEISREDYLQGKVELED
jgi:uncharacterized membrane protein